MSVRASLRVSAIATAIFILSAAGLPQAGQHKPPAPTMEARIDINHATVDELMKAPGMTRIWAGRIVRYRPYRTKLELMEHGVVTGAVYDRIKDYIIAHRDKQ
jgi:DNA uptake protein ComE-like DNA-binding protein